MQRHFEKANGAVETDGAATAGFRLNHTMLRVKDPTVPHPSTIVQMATMNGARALGIDDAVGSLEEGKVADVVMMDYARARYTPRVRENVLSNLVHFGAADDVALTMVGGRILVDDHRYVGGNEEAILEEAQRSGEEVWERAKVDWELRTSGGKA